MMVSFRPHWFAMSGLLRCGRYVLLLDLLRHFLLSLRTVALIRAKSSGVTCCPMASGFRRFRRIMRVAMSSVKSMSSCARRASRKQNISRPTRAPSSLQTRRPC